MVNDNGIDWGRKAMLVKKTNRIIWTGLLALFILADLSGCKLLTPDIVYVYEETQCFEVPWDDTSDDKLWGEHARAWLYTQGVDVSSVSVIWNRDYYCGGCGCPTGRYLEVIIEEDYVELVEALDFEKK